jgi:hypothetical protein
MTFVKAATVGITMAVVAFVGFTVCEFAVKYAINVAQATAEGVPIGGAAMAIPSPLSVLATIAGFVYGYRWTLRRESARSAY